MRTDGWRLAIGTFTRIPVPPPATVGRESARAAMLLGPAVMIVPTLIIGVLAQILVTMTDTPGLLGGALAIGMLAWLTRALHLDGLADTADALGSGRPATQALEIARRSDIGPFGVVVLVLTLVIQVIALGDLLDRGAGAGAVVIAVVTGRLAMMISCTPAFPAARPDGLGATVAGAVPTWAAWLTTLGWTLLFAGAVGRAHGSPAALATTVSIIGGILVGVVLARIARRRLGGITGDTLGASGELAMTTVLVLLVMT
ncbi:MAG TPA: adenosylcobinamide-GDP ribazoletransferase [Actinobacteria bacterium]|nr:adenosylcobinamide-GDP ribazoletransferase [Actinomycetota bacterium]